MKRSGQTFIGVLAALAAFSIPASAASVASATTPLNIRNGPGPEYSVIGSIPANGQTTVTGCIEGSMWCQINYNGQQGWAYSQYLQSNVGGQMVSANQVREVPLIAYTAPSATSGTTTVVRTISGDFIAPQGTMAPMSISPPPAVQTYVIQNPTQQVYLNGEVVEGVGLPQDVVLTQVPDQTYSYAYINGVPVLVEPTSRRVTYIYR